MKPKQILFVALFLLESLFSQAAILRVNSSLTTNVSQKIYQKIDDAVNAASAGDTLMIESSPLPYENATLTKPLVLIGPGYFLTENPQTQANGTPATVQQIIINASASGSILEGLTFSGSSIGYKPQVEANNIIITRCYLTSAIKLIGNLSSIYIYQNYFSGGALEVGSNVYSFSDVSFRNNYVGRDITIGSTNEHPCIFSLVENNVFSGKLQITASVFRSNIIRGNVPLQISSANIQNNLTEYGQLSGNGNQTYVASQLFVGATGNSTDGQYQLQSNSPYLKAGYNGTQPGMFGGSQPYVLSGMPPVPSIYEFTAEEVANKQTGLPVSIKVKANQ